MQVEDTQAEERAWKLFGLIPIMLMHRPRGTGAVGRDELAQRADDFARGQWTDLLQNASQTTVQPRPVTGQNAVDEVVRRGPRRP